MKPVRPPKDPGVDSVTASQTDKLLSWNFSDGDDAKFSDCDFDARNAKTDSQHYITSKVNECRTKMALMKQVKYNFRCFVLAGSAAGPLLAVFEHIEIAMKDESKLLYSNFCHRAKN